MTNKRVHKCGPARWWHACSVGGRTGCVGPDSERL